MFEGLEKRVNNKGTISYWKDDKMVSKYCTKCGELKSIEEFNYQIKKESTYKSMCKECERQYKKDNGERYKEGYKKWYRNNKERKKETNKKYFQKHAEYYKEYYRINKREYYIKNAEQIIEYKKQRRKDMKHENIKNITNMIEEIDPILKELNLPVYGYIYKIENIVTGRVYVGQTIRPLTERYHGGVVRGWIKERKKKQNQKFLEELIEENFVYEEVVAVGISQYHLDKLESYWIKEYNSCENGYNNYPGNHKSRDGLNEFNEILKENNLEFVDGELRRICDER